MHKSKVLPFSEAALFSMPSLEKESSIPTEEESTRSIEEIQRKAYEEGFAAGEKAGYSEGERKAARLMEGLDTIVREVALFKKNLVSDMEGQVVCLSTAIARKVITEEIRTRPEVIVSVVREALKMLQRTGTITIKMHPSVYEMFMKAKPDLNDIHQDILFDVSPRVSVTGPLVISQTEEVITDIDALMNNVVDDINGQIQLNDTCVLEQPDDSSADLKDQSFSNGSRAEEIE